MHHKIILMKKISAILLSAVLILTGCHNDGSSTVGVYENDEPKESTEHNKGHKEKMNEGHMADTASMHSSVDSAETQMSTEHQATETKKETEKH